MNASTSRTQNQAPDKAACRRGAAMTGVVALFFFALIFAATWAFDEFYFLPRLDAFLEARSCAINLGYDVNTQPTAAPADASGSAGAGAAAAAPSAVPVGNTGTTTTGHVL